MGRTPGKTYVEKDFRKNSVVLTVVLIITLIIIALVSLIPNRTSKGGDLSRIGVSRSFMFPFAYLDERNALKVIDSDLKILSVDDSVSSSVHDYTKEKIYYLREDVLYEYDIKLNKRRILVGGSVTDYRVLNDRSAFVYVTQAKELHLYDYITKKDIVLADDMPSMSLACCLSVGDSGFIFMGDGNAVLANLYYSDNSGNVTEIAKDVTVGTSVISENESHICFVKDNTLYITDTKGNSVADITGGKLISSVSKVENVASAPETGKFNEGRKISYVLSEHNELYWFTGKELRIVDSDVSEIVLYNEESSRIFYTKLTKEDSEDMEVLMSKNGRRASSVVKVSYASEFIWQEITGELYCLDGKDLKCIEVFDNFSVRDVATGVTGIKYYPGKSFVVYTDSLKNNYYSMPDGSIEQVANGSVRLYGLSANVYLLQSTYDGDCLSLDIVENDGMQRLDSDIIKVIALDSSLSQVMYLNNKGLMLRTDHETKLLDTPGLISCVPLKD
ncbi:MAG: hypothetical protein E7388_02775 [Ruminococcaceae bacterium]|nr:hypothetical protein [Oscillospiraceae bacterium]